MPTFKITAPDGKTYNITGDSPEGAMQALQKHLGGGSQETAPELTDAQKYAQRRADEVEKAYKPGAFEDATQSAVVSGLPFGDEIGGTLNTIPTSIYDWTQGEGFDLPRAFDRSIALEREMQQRREKRSPVASTVGAVAGNVGTMGMASNAGLSLMNGAKATLPSLMGRGAAEGTAYGTVYGAGEGENLGDRAENALKSGAIGGVLGGAIPPAATILGGAVKSALRPVVAPFMPDRFANSALGKTLERSGMTADEVVEAMRAAAADNQGMYTAADAMGNAGRRALVPAVRTPNDARQQITDFLMGRQLDQGRRVASQLSDASGTPRTAEQVKQALSTARSEQADVNYAPVRTDMTPINVTPAVAEANRRISPTAEYLAGVRGNVPTDLASRAPIEEAEQSIRDPIREAVREARSYLASGNLTVTNVEKAFRAKTNIDQMIKTAAEKGRGGQVEALAPIRDALDEALAATSRDYSAARDAYRTASQRVDAVDTGREMARGRTRVADNMDTFAGLPDDEARQAARAGYFDPKIVAAEKSTGTMTNAARPFNSESMRQELPAFAAPGQGDQLMRRLGRENTMSETSNATLGGSKTADNLADMEDAAQFDPAVMGRLFRGDFLGAASQGAKQALQLGKGQPPRVLERVGKSLIETDPMKAAFALGPAETKRVTNEELRKRIYEMLIGGAGQQVGSLNGTPALR